MPLHKPENQCQKTDWNYQIYPNEEDDFSKAMGIAFSAPEGNNEMLLNYSSNENKSYLAIPFVFVVNTEGVIRSFSCNPNVQRSIEC